MWTQRRVKRATTRPWEASTRHTLGHMSAASLPTDLFTMIDHVGVAVADLDEAIAFYSQTYGMRMLHEETNEEQGVREAMMAVGDSGSCIQLLAPLSPESTIAKFLDRSGPGIQQMAYRVAEHRCGQRDLA
jgi:methylmalonyl-CoA/ethylmalonyl-CoA epimerase